MIERRCSRDHDTPKKADTSSFHTFNSLCLSTCVCSFFFCSFVLLGITLCIISLLQLNMDLISWSLSAVDKLFSTRKLGAGEPATCPDGTYAAGYTRDYYNKWQVMCLSILEIEDCEDVIIFGFMVAGNVLIGLIMALLYRRISKLAALLASPRFQAMIADLARVLGSDLQVNFALFSTLYLAEC